MDRISIVEKIESGFELRSLPGVFLKILEESRNENLSAGRLAEIILQDPSLTGKILRLANSSFYSPAVEIRTVHQAVSMVGITTVKCLALSSAIFRPEYITSGTGLDAKEFFAFIFSVSSAAESIAKVVGYDCPEEALISGLLHDIGIVFFLHHCPDEYSEVLRRHEAGKSLINAEREIFDIDHCEVGYRLATIWHLPEQIISAIASHHDKGSAGNDDVLGNITKLAILLTCNRFSDSEQKLEDRVTTIKKLSKKLSMDMSNIAQITEGLIKRIAGMARTFGVEIGDTERLLSAANREIWKSYLTVEHLYKERKELSDNLLTQERQKGAAEAKNTALATMSHYVNNAAAVISGQFQLLQMLQKQGQIEKIMEHLPLSAENTEHAINKILAVIRVMREISPTDEIEFFKLSKAMKIDDRITECMEIMAKEPAVVLPIED